MTGQKETLQERLRKKADDCAIFDDAEDATDLSNIAHEAASALDAAEARIKELEKALEPFAEYLNGAAFDLDDKGNPLPDEQGMGWVYLNVGGFRRARAALQGAQSNE